jgi:hypothetical protein
MQSLAVAGWRRRLALCLDPAPPPGIVGPHLSRSQRDAILERTKTPGHCPSADPMSSLVKHAIGG